MNAHHVRIPKDRVGALIGPDGAVKEEIEARAGVGLEVDGETGEVRIDPEGAFEPVLVLTVLDVVKAIGRGFAPDRAFSLFQEDAYLDIVDLTDFVGKDKRQLGRVRSRIIGTHGRTRSAVEDATGCYLSVYGKTVSIIGDALEVQVAREAVEMIVNGAPHSAVYKFLERKRKELRLTEMGL